MRHLKTAFSHIRRSPYQALAAVLTMSLTSLVASIFVLLTLGSMALLRYFETRPQVTAFLKDEMGVEQAMGLKSKIEAIEDVREVKYVSKEEALSIYREQNKDDPLLLEMVTANILPASLEVSTNNLESLKKVAEVLKSEKGVEEVVFQEDVIGALSQWTGAVRKIGAGMIFFLGSVSLLVVLIIISMKIALRKEEIEVLRLVGAGSFYVSWPFILEGIIYGVLGAILGWGVSYLLLLYFTPFLESFLTGIPLLPVSPLVMLTVLGGEILVGSLLGAGGSLLAVKRYLK